jgi:hypothetical protein
VDQETRSSDYRCGPGPSGFGSFRRLSGFARYHSEGTVIANKSSLRFSRSPSDQRRGATRSNSGTRSFASLSSFPASGRRGSAIIFTTAAVRLSGLHKAKMRREGALAVGCIRMEAFAQQSYAVSGVWGGCDHGSDTVVRNM